MSPLKPCMGFQRRRDIGVIGVKISLLTVAGYYCYT